MYKKLFFLCIVLFSPLHGIIHTNKTFLWTPSPHSYVPAKYASSHRLIKHGPTEQNAWGATCIVTPFYKTSTNDCNLGKYFGANYKNELKFGRLWSERDIDAALIDHTTSADTSLTGTMSLHPKHTSYGIYLSYHHDLYNVHDGLFLEVNLGFQQVENDLRMSTTVAKLIQYLEGTYCQNSVQSALTHAKIKGLQSQSGISDIELILGYNFVEKEDYEVNGSVKVIIPTGKKPLGEYLFEPVIGSGKHWGIGARLDGSLNISRGEEYAFECLFHAAYTYLLRDIETRTLGFIKGFDDTYTDKNDFPVVVPWGHYLLGGEHNKKGVFPLANVLTRDVSVLPGGSLQGHVSFAYHKNNTTFDFGYSFLAKEGEKISVRTWENDLYALAHPLYDTATDFNVALKKSSDQMTLGGPIQKCSLDTETPASPAFLNHAIHAAVGYTLTEWQNPMAMGLGFSAEWNQDNSVPVGYLLWAKFGVTF